MIADLSVNYVERFVLEEGHIVRRLEPDYGYDLEVITYDEQGYVEPGLVYLQLKAAETLEASGADYVFDLDIRDYNLWMLELLPVVLVLFDASRRKAYGLHVQPYFRQDPGRQPRKGAKTVRVRVPGRPAFSRRVVKRIRELKQSLLNRVQVVQMP